MLLDELKLGRTERMDPATAARVGRLLRAERMVQGDGRRSAPRAGAALRHGGDGTGVVGGEPVTGPFRKAARPRKQVVLDLPRSSGCSSCKPKREADPASGPEEPRRVPRGTAGASSDGSGRLRRGGAPLFRSAAQADRSFQAARDGQQAATAAPPSSGQGGEISTVGAQWTRVRPRDGCRRAGGPRRRGGSALRRSARRRARDRRRARRDQLRAGSSTLDRHLTPESLGLPSIVVGGERDHHHLQAAPA